MMMLIKCQLLLLLFALAASCELLEASNWIGDATQKLKDLKIPNMGQARGRSEGEPVEEKQPHEVDVDVEEDEEIDDSLQGSEYSFKPKCIIPRERDSSFLVHLMFFSHKHHNPSAAESTEPIKLTIGQNDEEKEIKEMRQKLLGPDKPYDPSLMSFFIIHGFLDRWEQDSWQTKLKDWILNEMEANVFIVDWSGGSRPFLLIDYGAGVANTRVAGQHVARFIKNLINETDAQDAENFHMLGHSLGGHISGFIGYALTESNLTLGAITALDPAGPCFFTANSARDPNVALTGYLDPDLAPKGRRRLSASSARTVIAIHTDSSLFGLAENVGHFDVYANGGTRQPGCVSIDPMVRARNFMRGRPEAALSTLDVSCEHGFALDLITSFATHLRTFIKDRKAKRNNKSSGQRAVAKTAPQVDDTDEDQGLESKCYPMAYECSNWNQFKSGECGICLDDDPNCVYLGLTRIKESRPNITMLLNYSLFQAPDQCPFHLPAGYQPNERLRQFNQDLTFNEESDQQSNLKAWKPRSPLDDSNYLITTARHFMKTSKKWPHCMYQYQLVVAVNRAQQVRDARFFLRLPLDGNQPNGRERYVQISYQVERKTRAQYKLDNKLFSYLGASYTKKTLKELERQDLMYYTTLLTFESNPNCADIPQDDDSTICKPMATLEGAELLAENNETLAGVRWVAVNYMSGLKMSNRLAGSQLFKVRANQWGRNVRVKATKDRPKVKPLTMADQITGSLTNGRDVWRNGVAMSSVKYYLSLEQLQKS